MRRGVLRQDDCAFPAGETSGRAADRPDELWCAASDVAHFRIRRQPFGVQPHVTQGDASHGRGIDGWESPCIRLSIERPFGHADPAQLAWWAGATASWPNRTDPGGTRGLDDNFTRDFANNVGAEVMGRGKFCPQHGPWQDLEWEGWWGDTPPFHTPVFVLTHHARPSFSLSDTTFHFIDAEPHEALRQAKAAAERQGRAPRRWRVDRPCVP